MPKAPAARRPLEERFLYWLARAAKQTRENAGIDPLRIALLANLRSDATIKRFEQGKHWPVDPETLIAAYAHATGLDDPRAIFYLAMDLWYEAGKPPAFAPRPPGEIFEDQFRAPTPSAEPREPSGSEFATPRRRADD